MLLLYRECIGLQIKNAWQSLLYRPCLYLMIIHWNMLCSIFAYQQAQELHGCCDEKTSVKASSIYKNSSYQSRSTPAKLRKRVQCSPLASTFLHHDNSISCRLCKIKESINFLLLCLHQTWIRSNFRRSSRLKKTMNKNESSQTNNSRIALWYLWELKGLLLACLKKKPVAEALITGQTETIIRVPEELHAQSLCNYV